MNLNFDFLSQINWQSLNTWLLVLLGLIIGWLIEWLIDILYFRHRRGLLIAENADLSRQFDTVKIERDREIERSEASAMRIDFSEAEADRLRNDLEAVVSQRDHAQSEWLSKNQQLGDLDSVNVNSSRNYEDPIHRYRAEQAEEQVKLLQDNLTIAQKRDQAALEQMETLKLQRNQMEQKLKSVQMQLSQAMPPTVFGDGNDGHTAAEMSAGNNRIVELENMLNEQTLHAQQLEEKILFLEKQSSITIDKDDLQVQLDAANSRIAALQGEVNQFRRHNGLSADPIDDEIEGSLQQYIQTGGDDFLQINGIGHVFAQRLHKAGINSFATLAELSSRDVERIARPQSWQIIDASDWIQQAQEQL